MKTERMRATKATGITGGVDRQASVIRGAALMQAGDLNDDRPWTVDEQTLQQVVALGSQSKKGIKARFTHPSMSDDGMGKYLGQWHNLRVDGDTVRGDLHLSSTAYETPDGDLASYVLDLAEEAPEHFGNSVVVTLDRSGIEELPEGERAPMRVQRLHACDVVDEPAATRGGFFSVDSDHPAAIPAVVSRMIDEHFATCEPEELLDRFAGLLSKHFGRKVEPMANENKQAAGSVAAGLSREDGQRYIEQFGDAGARWYLEGKSFEECCLERIVALEAERDAALEQVQQVQQRLDAALAAAGEPDPVDPGQEPPAKSAEELARERRYQELLQSGVPESTARRAAGMNFR